MKWAKFGNITNLFYILSKLLHINTTVTQSQMVENLVKVVEFFRPCKIYGRDQSVI